MFEELEHVKIRNTGVTGIIVDKSVRNGTAWYTVESDRMGPKEGHDGGIWPLNDCTEADLTRIPENRVS